MLLTLFAGTNGTGKSTLYRANDGRRFGKRINIDEIAQGTGESKAFFPLQAGKSALQLIAQCLLEKEPFNIETTLCGKRIFRTIQQAKQIGYDVEMHYMYVETPEIAIERIRHRVEMGGHDIADEVVRRRYTASLSSLKQVLPLCNPAYIYDNSTNEGFSLVAVFQKGNALYISDALPDGLRTYIDSGAAR